MCIRDSHGIVQAQAITLGVARKRRSGAPFLPEWEIAAQNGVALLNKGLADGY